MPLPSWAPRAKFSQMPSWAPRANTHGGGGFEKLSGANLDPPHAPLEGAFHATIEGFPDTMMWMKKACDYGVSARDPLHTPSGWTRSILNYRGALTMTYHCLFAPDSITSCAMACFFVVLYWNFGQAYRVNMTWNVVSMGIIYPIAQSLGQGFGRREKALSQLETLLATYRSIWGALQNWTTKNKAGEWVRVVELLEGDKAAAGLSPGDKRPLQQRKRESERKRSESEERRRASEDSTATTERSHSAEASSTEGGHASNSSPSVRGPSNRWAGAGPVSDGSSIDYGVEDPEQLLLSASRSPSPKWLYGVSRGSKGAVGAGDASDTGGKGGSSNSKAQLRLRALFDECLVSLVTYLDADCWKYERLKLHACAAEKRELDAIVNEQRLCVATSLDRLHRLIQQLKTLGLGAGECSRLDQYHVKAVATMGQLNALKEYRTPRVFRAFARVFIMLLGAMYGPYYVYLGRGASGKENNLALSLAFACAIQLTICGLYHVALGLEDPFSCRVQGRGLDDIHVPELVEMTRRMMIRAEVCAGSSWHASAPKEEW